MDFILRLIPELLLKQWKKHILNESTTKRYFKIVGHPDLIKIGIKTERDLCKAFKIQIRL